MPPKFSFLLADIQFDMPKCEFILKNSSLKCWLCFRLFFVADTKIISDCNFVAPLISTPDIRLTHYCFENRHIFWQKVRFFRKQQLCQHIEGSPLVWLFSETIYISLLSRQFSKFSSNIPTIFRQGDFTPTRK